MKMGMKMWGSFVITKWFRKLKDPQSKCYLFFTLRHRQKIQQKHQKWIGLCGSLIFKQVFETFFIIKSVVYLLRFVFVEVVDVECKICSWWYLNIHNHSLNFIRFLFSLFMLFIFVILFLLSWENLELPFEDHFREQIFICLLPKCVLKCAVVEWDGK